MLALVGGAVGVGLAFLVMRAVVALMPQFMLPSETVIELNVPVLLFTVALSVVSGVLSGTAPAWQAARLDLNAMLKESGRAVQGGRHLVYPREKDTPLCNLFVAMAERFGVDVAHFGDSTGKLPGLTG